MSFPTMQVTLGSPFDFREKDRINAAKELYEKAKEVPMTMSVNAWGAEVTVWQYDSLEQVIRGTCKPLWQRLWLHPEIRKGGRAALICYAIFSFGPDFDTTSWSWIFWYFVFLSQLATAAGPFLWFLLMVRGSVLDLFDRLFPKNSV